MRISLVLCALGIAAGAAAAAPQNPAATPLTLYVAPDGNDAWSGRLARPNGARTDGPLATLLGARDAVRRLKSAGPLRRPVRVLLRGGTYRLGRPVVFDPRDSGTPAYPITYAAYPGERPVLSGGRVLRGWQRVGPNRFRTVVPAVTEEDWVFRQLFVNGRRWILARSPNRGYFYMAGKAGKVKDTATGQEVDGSQIAFRYQPGTLRAWPNLDSVDLVVYHIWETAILPVAQVDEENQTVVFAGPSKWPFGWCGKQRYVVENHPGALDAPGEWQLDRRTGVLTAIAPAGVDLTRAEVVAPLATQLLELRGTPEAGAYVEHLRFEGISFQHAEWYLPATGHGDWQAACTVDAAIQAEGARNCVFRQCEVAHTGNNGIWLRTGCVGNRIEQCHLHDLGAGGVRIGTDGIVQGPGATGGNHVVNNFIHDGGHVHAGAVGVWVGQSSDNVIAHNEICDLNYTGISVGWSWGYSPTACHRNRIEFNHLHHLGQQVLSDMGAIYTLGISTGTVIRNNLIHDICGYEYSGAGGIYPDEGSTGILIENNVVYNTVSGGLTIHYGQNLTVRNNIFAFGRDLQVSRGRIDKETNFTFERNVVYYDQGNLFSGSGRMSGDRNLYWHAGGKEVEFPTGTLDEWRAGGVDRNSRVADPLFVNPKRGDFRVRAGSPALQLGFQPIDTSRCGLFGPKEWTSLPRKIVRPLLAMPPRPEPKPRLIDDGFEASSPGSTADDVITWGEAGEATIRITREAAASGRQSLKFQDAPGLDYAFNPHLWYTPNLMEGVVRLSFDLRLEPGAIAWVEWRDAAEPYHVGPSLGTDADGQLLIDKKPVARLPHGEWAHIEVRCGLGRQSTGTWDVAVRVPGQPAVRLEKLPHDPRFKKLQWLGFVSNATERTAFYIDNVKLVREGGK